LGDLLTKVNLVSKVDLKKALDRQAEVGGRLGDSLLAIGAIEKEVLERFLHRIPEEPRDVAATGIDETELISLLMKLIYGERLESTRQFVEAIKLPYHIVLELVQKCVDRMLLRSLGTHHAESLVDMRYAITDEGRRWTVDSLQQLRYVGPAPVTLEDFVDQVNLQKVTNDLVTYPRIRDAFGDLTIDDAIVEQCGPALNSGRAMLLYGPPGNGKSSIARCFGDVFSSVIYVPYAISIDGQIIKVHDPALHFALTSEDAKDDDFTGFSRQEEFDARWVPCRRPFVLAGGELTLEMLDLRYDETGHYYEAPLHVKALGGCFVIDDFGRQLVSPTNLLNRWIVPLESRVDYLKLHTGKSFSVPFEELVIFSTNLEPEDLMDPAFLRRLPYKIEVGAPTLEAYRKIFDTECSRQSMDLPEDVFNWIVYKIVEEKGMELAAYHPKFIVDQVVATCRFMGQDPHFEPRFIDYAVNNLRVKRGTGFTPVRPVIERPPQRPAERKAERPVEQTDEAIAESESEYAPEHTLEAS
jgi:hypothetical protein